MLCSASLREASDRLVRDLKSMFRGDFPPFCSWFKKLAIMATRPVFNFMSVSAKETWAIAVQDV
jgi:hypothetical protein